MLRTLILMLLFCLFPVTDPAWAQGTGEVIDARRPAQIVSGGAVRSLERGSRIASGDEIRTGASGQVQILFPDETKIVVGSNSVLRIDEALFRNNGTARKFATVALGGSFRFISGKSQPRVYKLATPLATMAIRGTAFDYTVSANRATDLLVFNGLVRFCSQGGTCTMVPDRCQAVAILSDGRFVQPLTTDEKRALLIRRFPLLADQIELQLPFRADTAGCRNIRLITLPGTVEGERGGRSGGGGNPADGPSDSPGSGDGNPAD